MAKGGLVFATLFGGSLLLALGGCGVRGPLETPPPMWGDPDQEPLGTAEPFASENATTPEVILPDPFSPNAGEEVELPTLDDDTTENGGALDGTEAG